MGYTHSSITIEGSRPYIIDLLALEKVHFFHYIAINLLSFIEIHMAETRYVAEDSGRTVEINKVLRNTYTLLAMTIAFACLTGVTAIAMELPFIGFIPYLIGFFGLSFAVNKTANSSWGLFWTFMFTGFIGIAAAPIVNFYQLANPGVVAQAFGVTASAFFGLSAYTILTKKDFSFLGSFLAMAFWIVVGIIVCSFFFDLTPFAAAISGGMVLIAGALMLWQTSSIVLGGETNYIIATNNLFVSIYIMFMNLLSIFGIMRD